MLKILQYVGNHFAPLVYIKAENIQNRLNSQAWLFDDLVKHISHDIIEGRQMMTARPPANFTLVRYAIQYLQFLFYFCCHDLSLLKNSSLATPVYPEHLDMPKTTRRC